MINSKVGRSSKTENVSAAGIAISLASCSLCFSLASFASPSTSDLHFCNTIASQISDAHSNYSQNKSSSGGKLNAGIKFISVDSSFRHDMDRSSNSSNLYANKYNSRNCDNVLRYYGEVEKAEITARMLTAIEQIRANVQLQASNDSIRIAEIENASEVKKSEIEGSTAVRSLESQERIAEIRANSSLHVVDQLADRDIIAIKAQERIYGSQNKKELISESINAGLNFIGMLLKGSSRDKDRELELQLAREKNQHEVNLISLGRQVNDKEQRQAMLPLSFTPSLINRLKSEFGLVIIQNCEAPLIVRIFTVDRPESICANPTNQYSAGEYFLHSSASGLLTITKKIP